MAIVQLVLLASPPLLLLFSVCGLVIWGMSVLQLQALTRKQRRQRIAPPVWRPNPVELRRIAQELAQAAAKAGEP